MWRPPWAQTLLLASPRLSGLLAEEQPAHTSCNLCEGISVLMRAVHSLDKGICSLDEGQDHLMSSRWAIILCKLITETANVMQCMLSVAS